MPTREFILVNPYTNKIAFQGGKPFIVTHVAGDPRPENPPGYPHSDGFQWEDLDGGWYLLNGQRRHFIPEGHEVDPTKEPVYEQGQVNVARVHRRHHLRPIPVSSLSSVRFPAPRAQKPHVRS